MGEAELLPGSRTGVAGGAGLAHEDPVRNPRGSPRIRTVAAFEVAKRPSVRSAMLWLPIAVSSEPCA